jgi:chromosome segregation ATPase
MKAIKFYAIIAALAFLTASCIENSGKYKAAIAQRDSIAMEKQSLDSNYNQTIALLNDIENGFAVISQNESQMKVDLKGTESKTTKRDLIAAQMTAIKQSMDQNKAKIAELRNLESKKRKANILLTETIKRLQSELDAQSVQIQALQAELEQKNIKINELNITVDTQSKNISDQQSTIKGQDTDLNTVWYCVATSKQLQEAKIVSAGGLFKNSKVMDAEFDKKVFTQVDLRNISSIATGSKNVKILSTHPQNSYNLVTGADKKITIEITNPSKFWSVSKYLVVQI